MHVVPRACRDPHAGGQPAEQGAENRPRGCVCLQAFGEFLMTKRTTVAWQACRCGWLVLFICDEGGSDAEDAVPAQGTALLSVHEKRWKHEEGRQPVFFVSKLILVSVLPRSVIENQAEIRAAHLEMSVNHFEVFQAKG